MRTPSNQPHVVTQRSFELKVALNTSAPNSPCSRLPGHRIPGPRTPRVGILRRQESVTTWAEAVEESPRDGDYAFAVRGVPDDRRAISAGGGYPSPIRTESGIYDRSRVRQFRDQPAGADIPQAMHRCGVALNEKLGAVGAEVKIEVDLGA